MPLASISLSSPSASPPSTKSSFLSAFKKNKPVSSFSMAYTISTPRSANAKALQPGLPTVIFLHPVYLSQACFHSQFSDPNLRRFNMLAIDLRGHGSSSASLAAIPENYSLTAAAADIIQLMDTIGLDRAHVVGCSMGATCAFNMAHLAPDRILSVFAMSPLLQVEPDEVLQGREEIGAYWREGVTNNDTQALLDAARGAIELLFGEHPSKDDARIIGVALPLAIHNWAETGQQGSEIHRRVTIYPFTRREPLTKAELSRIQAPVVIVHSGEDAVTPLSGSEGLVREMREAGVGGIQGVELKVIPRAAHVANTTFAREINTLLYDFLLANHPQGAPIPPAPIELGAQQSPWFADLYRDQPTDEDDDY